MNHGPSRLTQPSLRVPTVAPPVEPARLGRFLLQGSLGTGGMGKVYRAELNAPGGFRKTCAIKLLPPSLLGEGEDRDLILRREARVGALLHHPHIVEIYDFGVTDGQPWMSMELVEGVDLERLVRAAGPMPPAALSEIAVQICDGLAHAHSARRDGREIGLVHRDLKPSNVLVSREGHVKVADFGVAKAHFDSSAATGAGVAKGTPAYMSPEQARGLSVDRRSDIFCLGAVLYWMACGRVLFRGRTAAAAGAAILNVDKWLKQHAILNEVEDKVPGLGAILGRALHKDPARRYPDARTMAADLELMRSAQSHGPSARTWMETWTELFDRDAPLRGLRRELQAFELPPPAAAAQLQTDPNAAPTTERRYVEESLNGAAILASMPSGAAQPLPPEVEAPAARAGISAEPDAPPIDRSVATTPSWPRDLAIFLCGCGLGLALGVWFVAPRAAPWGPWAEEPRTRLSDRGEAAPPSGSDPTPTEPTPHAEVPPTTTDPTTDGERGGSDAGAALLHEFRSLPSSSAAPQGSGRGFPSPSPSSPDPTLGRLPVVVPAPPATAETPAEQVAEAVVTGLQWDHRPVLDAAPGSARTFVVGVRQGEAASVQLFLDTRQGLRVEPMRRLGDGPWVVQVTLPPDFGPQFRYWFEADVGDRGVVRLTPPGEPGWTLRLQSR